MRNNSKKVIVSSLIITLLVLLLFSCNKEISTIPVLKTSAISDIKLNSVVAGGHISSDGGAKVTNRGVCWSINPNPGIEDNKTTDGEGVGIFSSTISNLDSNSIYFVRAYAINSVGIAYGDELSFLTGAITDIDGNIYRIVTIGTQVWMVDNLKSTKYNDGTIIPLVTGDADWTKLSTPAYCWPANDEGTYKATYGALYNWYAVNTNKLCPEGWHVPTIDDWYQMISYWGGENLAGGRFKEVGEVHWSSPNTGADNLSGFTALSGRFRNTSDGTFNPFGYFSYFWSADSSDLLVNYALTQYLQYNTSKIITQENPKGSGLYVRCIRD